MEEVEKWGKWKNEESGKMEDVERYSLPGNLPLSGLLMGLLFIRAQILKKHTLK